MDEKIREEIALFRFGLIAPLLNDHVDRKDDLARVSAKKHAVPHFGEKEFRRKRFFPDCSRIVAVRGLKG